MKKRRRWGLLTDPTTGQRGCRLIHDPDTGDLYLRRWPLITTPWFEIKLHHIVRPDAGRDMHDHPWWFISFVLRGWYQEEVPFSYWGSALSRTRLRFIRWFNHKPATGLHRIVSIPDRGVWTLVCCGPRRREWGFMRGSIWVDWRTYLGVNDT